MKRWLVAAAVALVACAGSIDSNAPAPGADVAEPTEVESCETPPGWIAWVTAGQTHVSRRTSSRWAEIRVVAAEPPVSLDFGDEYRVQVLEDLTVCVELTD